MPEIYKNNFHKLFQDKKEKGYKFFEECIEKIDGKDFKYLVCNIDSQILNCAIELAKEKSHFTMDQNQANVPREPVVKLEKCAQGVLAEMFVHFLLVDRYGLDVLRYDLERPTFEYKNDEYDLKIVASNNCYKVESRSSNVHHKSVSKFVNEDVIIGPYGNARKAADELADFHFRPIYMPDFCHFYEKDESYHYNQNMINGTVKLVITGVATKEEFLKYSYETSLGQHGTRYSVVDAKKIGDVSCMDEKFKHLKQNSNN